MKRFVRRARARLYRRTSKRDDREWSDLGDALRLVAGFALLLIAALAAVGLVLYLLLR